MNTTTHATLVIAFVVVVLICMFFGGGAMTGGMMGGGMDGSESMGGRSWMWTPTLLTLGLGVVLGTVIYKKGLLQTEWEKGDIDGLSQTFPDGLHAGMDADRFAQSRFTNDILTVLSKAAPSSN